MTNTNTNMTLRTMTTLTWTTIAQRMTRSTRSTLGSLMLVGLLGASLVAADGRSASASASVEFFSVGEAGLVFQGYGDVQIPGVDAENPGDRFSLTDGDPFETDPLGFVRLELGVTIDEEHTLFLTGLPFQFDSYGTIEEDLEFDGETFAAGSFVRTSFRFNSWRLTYRWDGADLGDTIDFGVGFTAKIRDAEVSVETANQKAAFDNIGFVPLVHLYLRWAALPGFGLLTVGDGLAGGPGRAFDFFLGIWGQLAADVWIRGGWRFLDGGADNETVYNFNLVHFAAAAIVIEW